MLKHKRMGVSLCVALVGCVAAIVGQASASTKTMNEPTTLQLQLRGGTSTFVDSGAKGPSIGDRIVLNQPAYFQSNLHQQVGSGVVTITLVGGRHLSETQDVATLVLPGGQISVLGIQTSSSSFTLPIVGGSGEFQQARGQVHVQLMAHNTTNVTVSLDS